MTGRPIRRALFLMIAAMFGLANLTAHEAHAATTCTASVDDIIFGDVNPWGTVNVTANVNYDCTSNVPTFARSQASIRMCIGIGAGSQSESTISKRVMRNIQSDPLEFQLFRDSARSLVWGNIIGTNAVAVSLTYPIQSFIGIGGEGSGRGTTTIYGQVPAQQGIAEGDYNTSFSTDTLLTFRYADRAYHSEPGSCNTGGGTQGTSQPLFFQASARVWPRCTINVATDLDFGTVPGLIDRPEDQTSSISFACTGRTPWNVGLDDGQNASGSVRRMRFGTTNSYVNYELYRDPTRTQRWGTTVNVDTLPGTGTGNPQPVTVYGRVPDGQSVPAGNYTDTITVTVTY